jgi:hypothetical protein
MEDNDWFQSIWEHREVTLYPTLFGPESEGIFTIPYERLATAQLTDPRWPTCGVFRFAPTKERSTWLYISSGLSNEWFEERPDPQAVSGFGCEFVIETPDRADWPIQRLHQIMCYQMGLCLGRYEGSDPLSIGFRVPLGSPIDFRESALQFLLLIEPIGFTPKLLQKSGTADLIELVGISQSERDYAQRDGNEALINWLSENTTFPATDPNRRAKL